MTFLFGMALEETIHMLMQLFLLDAKNWAVEEARIRGGYNNTSVELGVKAYLVEENPNASLELIL